MAPWDRLPVPPIRLPRPKGLPWAAGLSWPRGLAPYTVERALPVTMPDGVTLLADR